MIYIYIFNGLKNSIESFFVTDENDMKFVNEGLLEQSHQFMHYLWPLLPRMSVE